MRPKTRRRLLVIVAVVVGLIALLGIPYGIHKVNQYRELIAARDIGLAAFTQGKYEDVVKNLGNYLSPPPFLIPIHNRTDPDLIYKFALSNKCLATDGDRQHLELAKNWFQMHLSLKPDSLDALKQLLEIYPRLGRVTEALEAADRVIRQEPANTTALRIRIECQMLLGRAEKALESAQKLAEVEPDDVENTVRVFYLLRNTGKTADILPTARKRYLSSPDSAAGEIILSVAYSLVEGLTPQQRADAWALAETIDPDRSIRKLRDPNVTADSFGNYGAAVLFARKAAARPLASQPATQPATRPVSMPASMPASRPAVRRADIALTRVIVSQLDRLALVFDSLALLETIDPAIDDPWVRSTVIQRLWECNRLSEVNRRLASFSPKQTAPGEIELHAIHAICLIETNHKDEASKIVDELSQMKGNKVAAAWEAILRQQYLGAKGDLSLLVRLVKDAIASVHERSWPYLWASLGDAYMALGERDLSAYAFARARDAAPLWFFPRVKLSRLLSEMGQPGAATAEAEAARMVLPHPITQGNYLVVAATKTVTGSAIDPAIARQVADLQKQFPGDESTLALYIRILVQDNQKDLAQKVLRDALAKEKSLSLTSLIGLAVVSRNAKLGLENECIDLALKKYGMTPELALMQASLGGSADNTAEILALYKQARDKNAKPETDVSWRLGSARLLESLRDPNAAKAWAELGDDPALKDNLMVQKAVLGAASAQSDRPLLDRTIDRIKVITGDDVAVWREARARVLMQDRTPASTAQARKLLDETIRLVPASVDAHLLLGTLLAREGDLEGSLKQYAESVRLRPNPSVLIQMARLHLQRSEFAKAREFLDAVALPQIDDGQKAQAAMVYAQLGDLPAATAIAKGLDTSAATDPSIGLFLVQIDRKNGNNAQAESRLLKLAKTPTFAVITSLADLYASTGRIEQARTTLAQLQSLKLEPGQRELAEAEFLERFGSPRQGDTKEAAEAKVKAITEKFANAAKAAPDDFRTQVAYISNLLHHGRLSDALTAARQASSSLPSYLPLESFLKQEQALTVLKDRPDAFLLGESILQGHADSVVAAEALSLLVTGRTEQISRVVARLRPLADRSPLLTSLQLIVINGYRAMGQVGDAANIASRTAKSVPNSVEFARLAAQINAEAGDWTQALAAAQTWKQLAPADTLEADILCAEAHIRQQDYAAAGKEIARYLPAAIKDPDALAAVIRMQSRILVATGGYEQARELLKPLLREQPWRMYYYKLASIMIKDADVAATWFRDIEQSIPAAEIEERVNIAGGWIDRGVKDKREDFRVIGRDMLRSLLQANPKNVTVVYGAALFHALDGDRKAAEDGYRKALTLEPKHSLALNNLAMLLAEDKRNLDEAAALVARSLEVQPNVSPFLDTQAFIEGLRKNRVGAMAAVQRAVDLDPANPNWRLRKIELLLDFGDRKGASEAFTEIDQINKTTFTDEVVAKLQALRTRVSGPPATLPSTR